MFEINKTNAINASLRGIDVHLPQIAVILSPLVHAQEQIYNRIFQVQTGNTKLPENW